MNCDEQTPFIPARKGGCFVIVGTAGHIDHGKTTLIKCLTSVNTDSLEEEKKRGISINIGFAYLSTPMGDVIGFVDAPGHEKFITNMLAGACEQIFVISCCSK